MRALLPNRQVSVGSIGLPLGVIVVWLMESNGIVVPDQVAAAIGSVLVMVLAWFARRGVDE